MPPIEWAMYGGMQMFFIALDTVWSLNPFKTSSKTIQQFVDIHCGPEYAIHYRYSSIVKAIIICLMYGPALPILYPITFVTMIVMVINERLVIFYYNREPPTFDDDMTVWSIKISEWTLWLSLPFSFWIMGNRQIYDNAVYPIQYSTDIRLSGHVQVFDEDPEFDYTAPILVFFIAFVAYEVIDFLGRKMGFISPFSFEYFEDLPNYYDAIEIDDREDLINECNYYKDKYDMTYNRAFVNRIQETRYNDKIKKIQGIPFYDILANQEYIMAYQYLPVDVPNRDLIIQDGDDDDTNNSWIADSIFMLVNLEDLDEKRGRELSMNSKKSQE
jgi:hypothetical protein